jgi:hypothetical protein
VPADRGKAAGFAAALHELYVAAGGPTYATLMRQAGIRSAPVKPTAASLGDWLNGVSVPSSPVAFKFLVGYLRFGVPGDAGHRSRSDAWWEARRAEAERERHAARGGRPKRPREERRAIVNLPYRAAGRFVGRGPELGELDAAAAPPGSVIVQVVHGLGGVGKSTLAAHWAATRTAGFAVVWWNTADTPTLMDEGLAGLAVALDPAAAGDCGSSPSGRSPG